MRKIENKIIKRNRPLSLLVISSFLLFFSSRVAGAQTWQQTLEQNFDIADTFDDYQDWKGLAGRTGSECQTNPNDLPKYQNGTNGLWDMYCYASDSVPGDYGNWIANHGPSYQVGTKSLKLGTQGHNAAEIKTYIGDGNPSSGYSDIYVFYRLYLPKNTWPTYIVKTGNSGTWLTSQSTPPESTGIVGYREGEPYLFLTGWKFFNIGLGFCNIQKWEDPTDGDNVCGSGYYGDGSSIYGSTEIWDNLIRNSDIFTISNQLSTISAQPPLFFPSYNVWNAKPNYISTDELVGIELHYKLETNTSCAMGLDCDGQFESWVYDSKNPNGLKLQDTQKIKFRGPGHDASKINRLWINGNKHDYDVGEGGITGEYYCGEGMDCFMYVDDFIVDDQRVGPTYFSLLNNQPPPTDTTPPTVPTGPTATAISPSQINLSWTTSTDNVGVTGYKIYRCAGSACAPTVQIATSATNSYSDTGLTASTAYTYTVSAYDAANNESNKSTLVGIATLGQLPYPLSSAIETIVWDQSTYVSAASGSDIWPITWGADGNLYASWGDGEGFPGGLGDSSWGVARIQGLPPDWSGVDLFGKPRTSVDAGKITGLLGVNGTIYLWLQKQDDWKSTRIVKSSDNGNTWSIGSYILEYPLNRFTPIQFGPNYDGARDSYIYGYLDPTVGTGSSNTVLYLARVPTTGIESRSAYEIFSGFDVNGNPKWSVNLVDRKPVFTDSAGVNWGNQAVYHPVLKRYLLTVSHGGTNGEGPGLGVFDAPEPWGPWTTVYYTDAWKDTANKFSFSFPQKWMSADGKSGWMIHSGWPEYDGYHHVKYTPTLKTAMDITPPTITSVNTLRPTQLVVAFSEPVEEASATAAANYTIDKGITISAASLGSDQKTVTLTTSPHQEGIIYTLTVNNIKDRATIPNTIALNSKASYSYTPKLVITNLSIASGKAYEVVESALEVGALAYIDRSYTYTAIPAWLLGATYIKTANDDKALTDTSFLSFTVNQDAIVYVAHDNRITAKPAWLQAFTDTGEDIATSDTAFSVFMKDFTQGQVSLGGNEGAGGSMYTVIIAAKGLTTTKGDVQCDKAVDILDVQALVNCILGTGNCDWGCGNSADANDDKSVDILDVQLVVNVILGE